jgi:hypothetical protein
VVQRLSMDFEVPNIEFGYPHGLVVPHREVLLRWAVGRVGVQSIYLRSLEGFGLMPAKQNRVVIRIIVDALEKDALEAVCEARGMTQISALTRLVHWFGRLPREIQVELLKGDIRQSAGLQNRLLSLLASKLS